MQAVLEDDLHKHVHMDQPPIAAPIRSGSAAAARAASVSDARQRRSGSAASAADDSGSDGCAASGGRAAGRPPRKNKAGNRPPAGGGRSGSKALQENADYGNAEASRRGSASRLQPKRGARTQKAMLDEPELPPSSSDSGSHSCSPVAIADSSEDGLDPMHTPLLARRQPDEEVDLESQTDEVMRSMVAMHVDELEQEAHGGTLGGTLLETKVQR